MEKSLKIDIFNSFKTKSFEDDNFCLLMSEILLISEHHQKLKVFEDSLGDLRWH